MQSPSLIITPNKRIERMSVQGTCLECGRQTVQESVLSKGIRKCGYHVCILGTIAAGKTTMCRALQDVIIEKEGRCDGLYEPVESNPYLSLYYEDPKRYAFPMQIYMLTRRLRQQRRAQANALDGISSVQDSSVFGDSCFVEMLNKDGILSDLDVENYADAFIDRCESVMYPSLVVYLNCPAEVAKQRVIKRGRECEKNIEIAYLDRLNVEIGILCRDFERYTFVKEINASVDLTPEEIKLQARMIYDELSLIRKHPIISRMGV